MASREELRDWFCREVLPLEPALARFLRRNWRDQEEVGSAGVVSGPSGPPHEFPHQWRSQERLPYIRVTVAGFARPMAWPPFSMSSA